MLKIRMGMKIWILAGLILLVPACSSPATMGNRVDVNASLQIFIDQVLEEFDEISPERRETLNDISEMISSRLVLGENANLTFICTHNSRRSHMSQVWAETAAFYYGIDQVFTYSGGTDETACNIRTIQALQRAGFSVSDSTYGDNPVYLIQYSDKRPPIKAYSKLYNHGDNPQEEFIALMCCSKADRQCPVVQGSSSRFAIHYEDPKECDDTSEETEVYDERCWEIAREMFYIMSTVNLENGAAN